MRRRFGSYGPAHPWLGAFGYHLTRSPVELLCSIQKFYKPDSRYARERAASMLEKLRAGKTVYLIGIGPSAHNAGVALVEASPERGVRLICNNEEERFSGVKNCTDYPQLAVAQLLLMMERMGIGAEQIHACLASWNYAILPSLFLRLFLEEAPGSFAFLHPSVSQVLHVKHVIQAYRAPSRLGKQLGLKKPLPIIGLRHHDNHAYFSYAVSPFAWSEDHVMIAVLDGTGDDGSISLYIAKQGQLKLRYRNQSVFDSLGIFYSMISSTQGGWTMLSSEGRYMGAVAWGNTDRLTNPYYRQLRQLFYFGNEGKVFLNRALANWPRKLDLGPYTAALSKILGPPIPLADMWNPDTSLTVENIQHIELTRERLDKAAATQLLFEDVLFHVVGHLIRETGSNKLVLTGGTALNCIANMSLLEHFDEAYYQRYLNRTGTRLHLWVPPTPGDSGAPTGAAYHFAIANGAPIGEPLRHAFYCGLPPATHEVLESLSASAEIEHLPLGNLSDTGRRDLIADLLVYIISRDGVVGVFQGVAETGPRALGHRSIFANPRNPKTRENLNRLVKFRELLRPLAPMATYDGARRWFELSAGASDDDYNAYNYMVLAARAHPESFAIIPAVIHKDGTGRVQIVREEIDPFTHAYLKAMGRRAGVEVSVNTSLNIGGPIVQTPTQAIQVLKRSKGLDGLLLVGAEGDAFLAWHSVMTPPKDRGQRLQNWLQAWQQEVGVSFP